MLLYRKLIQHWSKHQLFKCWSNFEVFSSSTCRLVQAQEIPACTFQDMLAYFVLRRWNESITLSWTLIASHSYRSGLFQGTPGREQVWEAERGRAAPTRVTAIRVSNSGIKLKFWASSQNFKDEDEILWQIKSTNLQLMSTRSKSNCGEWSCFGWTLQYETIFGSLLLTVSNWVDPTSTKSTHQFPSADLIYEISTSLVKFCLIIVKIIHEIST